MDLKVYQKEEVKQPSGSTYVITPNIIDLYSVIETVNGVEVLKTAEILTTESEILEQACALATIWQKGLDPVDIEDGIRWSEGILEEINVVQLMEDIREAVYQITPTVEVVFSSTTDANGNSYLVYTLKAGE